jgi:hypothetical protein
MTAMNKMSTIAIMLLFFSIAVGGCKKQCKDPSNPECPNYDPCFGKSDVSADFDVLTQLTAWYWNKDGFLTVDASVSKFSNNLIFKAKDASYKHYEWSVGTDIRRWRESEFFLSFGFREEQTIPVTLIVEGDPKKNCTDKTDWKDTLTRHVRFVNHVDFAIFGEYTGYLTNNPAEIFNVRIVPNAVNVHNVKVYVAGLPFRYKEEIESFFDTIIPLRGTANNVITFSDNAYNSPIGVGILNVETNELTIEYNRVEPYPPAPGGTRETWPRKSYIFKGVKVK